MENVNFFRSVITAGAIVLGGAVSNVAAATPLTTVPWNGHVGAVSFTFDDALENQVQNLKPILDEMPDVQVTLFLTSMSYYFTSEAGAKGFASLAKAGHEIGNHSLTHGHFTGKSKGDETLKEEIIDHADFIEKHLATAGADVKISSFATPYCANDDAITDAINQRHFINRDCGDWGYRKAWNKEPEWFKWPALIWTRSGKKVDDITVALDTCIGNADFSGLNPWETPPGPEGEWMVVLNHGVAEDNDDYAIDPTDIKTIIQHARDNKMWIASMGTVGAYFMAHFTLDAATAVAEGNSYKVSWELPHPNMPASIPMKVKLNNDFLAENFGDMAIRADGTVPHVILEQDGKAIFPDEDGIFNIEFNALGLTIRLANAEEESGNKAPTDTTTTIRHTISKRSLMSELLSDKRSTYTLFDLNGNNLGNISGFEVPASMPKGSYIIRGDNPNLRSLTIKVAK